MPSSKDHVRAIVRFRPTDGPSVWKVDKKASTVNYGGNSSKISGAGVGEEHTYNAVFTGEDTNKVVYENSIKPIVDDCLDGKNACVLCYGQTGSGKTHSMFGYSAEDKGFLPQAIEHAFEHFSHLKRSARFRVAMSFYEIYNETVNDLLATDSEKLSVREVNGVAYVEGLNIRMCHDTASAVKLIDYGTANKTVGNSYIHDKSSRAHTVFQMHFAVERRSKDVISTQVSRINFVDLAGSEMLSYNFGDQQQKETKAINMSLLSLRNVISALANKEGHVPFRDSVLTRLLAPCLSENSVTAVMCTCNPAQEHASLTNGSLRFGDVSKMIEQHAIVSEFVREGSKKLKLKAVAEEEAVNLEDLKSKRKKGGESTLFDIKDTTFGELQPRDYDTRQGRISGFMMKPGNAVPPEVQHPHKIAICLHAFGNSCCGSDFEYVMRGLASLGYTSYTLDFPGFGETPGARQASRTDRLDMDGGPMEIVYDVLDDVTKRNRNLKVLFVGWDWGGNMAFTLALNKAYKNRISALIQYHPSYTNPLEELNAISLPVLLLWIPSDQLHLISSGKKMARIIKKSKLSSLVLKAGTSREYFVVWDAMTQQILSWIPQNLKALPPPKPKQSARPSPPPEEPKEEPVASSPKEVEAEAEKEAPDDVASSSDDDLLSEAGDDSDDDDTLSTQSSFLACILCDPMAAASVVEGRAQKRKVAKSEVKAAAVTELQATSPKPSEEIEKVKWSVTRLREILSSESKSWMVRDALQRRNDMGALRPVALGLVGHLPPVLPNTKASDFVTWGLWAEAPRGNAFDFPRYPPGRQVFVKAPVNFNFKLKSFGTFSSGSKANLTYRARISAKATSTSCIVDVDTESGSTEEVTVTWDDVYKWNQPTSFPSGPLKGSTLVFEDAINCRYHDMLTKTKLCEMALAVAPIAARMDFTSAIDERKNASAGSVKSDFPANATLLRLQMDALKKLRKCVNMIHHVQMGKDPKRLCVPDAGRLATHGQWHCHGMASVFAAMVLPFADALGIEIRYRDGFTCSPGERDGTQWDGQPRSIADHTWLEMTLFPSGTPVVVDPSFDHNATGAVEGPIAEPWESAYVVEAPICPRFPMRNLTSGGVESCKQPIDSANHASTAPMTLSSADFCPTK